eukprot:gnl/MRDRNA2_/MRDRNA2_51849_c0_seq1.p2 gnl/MRDRNA2_/MRDRNA2_51849_c0~~gnl/MRDRNA2_/MRDRNA2_51849_c0_seq1.p2  ORF type:complete len:124 (-),score=6.97 gnl/MRDRNA2_/MRDRNA2_51849_c0_seq1:51-422(-)
MSHRSDSLQSIYERRRWPCLADTNTKERRRDKNASILAMNCCTLNVETHGTCKELLKDMAHLTIQGFAQLSNQIVTTAQARSFDHGITWKLLYDCNASWCAIRMASVPWKATAIGTPDTAVSG